MKKKQYFGGFGPGIRDGKPWSMTYDLCGKGPGGPPVKVRKRLGEKGGVFFQVPAGWDDGRPGLKRVERGHLKGRLYYTSRREGIELAKRISGKENVAARFDPM